MLEVCCGSADDVIEAHKAGADRVELNSDLFHGGLTPTLGELIVAKRETPPWGFPPRGGPLVRGAGLAGVRPLRAVSPGE